MYSLPYFDMDQPARCRTNLCRKQPVDITIFRRVEVSEVFFLLIF